MRAVSAARSSSFQPRPAGAGRNRNFRFHDLRHTFASWYMMNGGDLYELTKILGHSNMEAKNAKRASAV
jgi:integrase